MLSFSRLVFILLIAIFAVILAAPRQIVMGFGKRSVNSFEDEFSDISSKMKRYKPKGFAMGFGKRGQIRSFNMGFGKRSADLAEPSDDEFAVITHSKRPSSKDKPRALSFGLGKRATIGTFGNK